MAQGVPLQAKNKDSEQSILNQSFDPDFNILAIENLEYNGNALVRKENDPTSAYSISDLDESSATKYYGYLKADGGWYILKLTSTEARYAKGTSGYNWANRASETYDTFANTF